MAQFGRRSTRSSLASLSAFAGGRGERRLRLVECSGGMQDGGHPQSPPDGGPAGDAGSGRPAVPIAVVANGARFVVTAATVAFLLASLQQAGAHPRLRVFSRLMVLFRLIFNLPLPWLDRVWVDGAAAATLVALNLTMLWLVAERLVKADRVDAELLCSALGAYLLLGVLGRDLRDDRSRHTGSVQQTERDAVDAECAALFQLYDAHDHRLRRYAILPSSTSALRELPLREGHRP